MNDTSTPGEPDPNDPADAASSAAPDRYSQIRIKKILRRTKREAGVRDLINFTFGAWSALLVLGGSMISLADQLARNAGSQSNRS